MSKKPDNVCSFLNKLKPSQASSSAARFYSILCRTPVRETGEDFVKN